MKVIVIGKEIQTFFSSEVQSEHRKVPPRSDSMNRSSICFTICLFFCPDVDGHTFRIISLLELVNRADARAELRPLGHFLVGNFWKGAKKCSEE